MKTPSRPCLVVLVFALLALPDAMLRSARRHPLALVTLFLVIIVATSAFAAAAWTDPPEDVTHPSADLISGSVTVHGDQVDLRWQTVAAPFPHDATYHVTWCFDLDRDSSTGNACGSGRGSDVAIGVREPGARQGGRLNLHGLPGLDVCSMLSFDPATNTSRLLVPLSSFGGDADFDYVLGVAFGGSFGNNESSGWYRSVADSFDAWSGAPFCDVRTFDAGPSVLSFIGVVGDANPPDQRIHIRERGLGVNWVASAAADWLSMDPTASSPRTKYIHVSADSYGLAPGIYTDEIVVSSDAAESPPPVKVTLSVVERVSLAVVRSFSTTRFGSPTGLAYDPSSHRLWLTGGGVAGDTTFEITNRGRPISSFASSAYGGANPNGVAVDPETRDLWIIDAALDTVFRVSRGGVQLSAFPTGVNSVPAGVGFDPELGELFTADGGGAAHELFVWSSDGAPVQSFDLNPLGVSEFGSRGVVFDSETAHLFVTDSRKGKLYEIDTQASLAQVYDLVPLGIAEPLGVALDPVRRSLWILDGASDRVVELAFQGDGQPYAMPVSLDVDPGNCDDSLSLSQQRLTLAIAGSSGFDVRDIDAEKIRLEGVEPLKKSRADKTSPMDFVPPGAPAPACPAPDGQLDSVFQFSAADVVAALEARLHRSLVPGERVVLNLTGKLRYTARRVPIRGMGWAHVTE